MIRLKRNGLLVAAAFVVFLVILALQTGFYNRVDGPQPAIPIYKPLGEPPPPIKDNFPKAASAKSPSDLPPIPVWNKPPDPHMKEDTPLFIGFTRNWRLLQQVVVSYITAGWPPGDIYVVENPGVMHSNKDAKLSLQSRFYIDYNRLTKVFGINVLITPTLLTFAQLQNFYTFTAVEKGWRQYFWAHMDTVMISDEAWEGGGEGQKKEYKSAYTRAVEVMRESMAPGYGKEPGFGPLATRWYAYDRLALVRTQSFVDVGGWDTLIPFYMTDCDMHERLWMKNFTIEDAEAGRVWDLDTALDDLEILYQRGESTSMSSGKRDEPQKNSPRYKEIISKLDEMGHQKNGREGGRNTWQARQKGGQGEPFYRDSDGFEKGIQMTMDFGRDVFTEKWGRGPCNLREAGLKDGDAWRVVKDWESFGMQSQARKDQARKAKEQAQKANEDKAGAEKEATEKQKEKTR